MTCPESERERDLSSFPFHFSNASSDRPRYSPIRDTLRPGIWTAIEAIDGSSRTISPRSLIPFAPAFFLSSAVKQDNKAYYTLPSISLKNCTITWIEIEIHWIKERRDRYCPRYKHEDEFLFPSSRGERDVSIGFETEKEAEKERIGRGEEEVSGS